MGSLQTNVEPPSLFNLPASQSEYRGSVGPEPDETMRRPARASDPSSSHIAAEKLRRSGAQARQVQLVADAVKRHPGLTSRELAVACDIDRHLLGRRLPEAEQCGLLRRGAKRECKQGKTPAVTWWPAETK